MSCSWWRMARGHRVEKDTDGQSDESGRALRSVCFCPISILLISPVRRNNYWIIGLMGKKMTSLSGLHRKMLLGCRKSRVFPGKSRITGKWQTHIYADAFKHVQNSTVFRWFRLIFRRHCLHFQSKLRTAHRTWMGLSVWKLMNRCSLVPAPCWWNTFLFVKSE